MGYMPPPGPGRYGAPAPAPTAEGKAVLSLVLGVVSMTCLGLVTGIPAVILGVVARRDIGRSRGGLGSEGFALGGIVTGATGTVMSLVAALFLVAGLVVGHHATSARRATAAGTTSASPRTMAHPRSYGALDVVDLDGSDDRTLREQLAEVAKRAAASKNVLVVQTSAKWCRACDEFDESLGDPRMQTALTGVTLVRVDVDHFAGDLEGLRMDTGSVPWFFKIDSSLRATDAISADEWDDNVAGNIAPVLRSFIAGTLKKRRNPAPMGTAL